MASWLGDLRSDGWAGRETSPEQGLLEQSKRIVRGANNDYQWSNTIKP